MTKRPLFLVAMIVGLAWLATPNLVAETPPLWGDLEPGQYGVGFETIEQYDHSRTFGASEDYFGTPQPGETARPLQICIWYPANPAEDQTSMVYGEYSYPYPSDASFIDLLSGLQQRDLGALFFFLGNSQPLVQGSMDKPLLAVRDAVRAEGSFPLVIYHPGRMASFNHNVVLCEYLASHGLIVATTHTLGTVAVEANLEGRDLEMAVRDKEFVLGAMHDYANVNSDRVGLLGYGFGGLTAVIQQMRNADIDAVISLQGTFIDSGQTEFCLQQSFFDPFQAQVPLMLLYAQGMAPVDLGLLDSMRYSDRYLVHFPGQRATDFTTHGLISTDGADTSRVPGSIAAGHNAASRYILNFFQSHLDGDETAASYLALEPAAHGYAADFAVVTRHSGGEVPPSGDQFTGIVQNYPIERAVELVDKFKLTDPAQPVISGPGFTALGYQFLQRGRSAEALIIFKMGVEAYPGSANAWDSYGEAAIADGNNELALANYRMALEKLPDDADIAPGLRQALTNGVPGTIERLEALVNGESTGDGE